MNSMRIGAAFAMVMAMIIAACGPSGTRPDESGEITIIQIDEEEGMRFEPGEIVLTAGQPVRIILENQGEKDHEFMIGRDVQYMADGAPNGFAVDFFKGIEDQVTVMLGEGAMLMIDDQMIMMDDMGMDEEMAMEEEEMAMEEEAMAMEEGEMAVEEEHEHEEEEAHMDEPGHLGWMVMDAAGSGPTVIEFVVPLDRVGEWEMGCFEDDGSHYEDGMRGTLVVVEG